MLILFDIDGTIADCNHRLPYIKNKPKNWKRFFDTMGDDLPIKVMIDTYHALYRRGTNTIILLTGRPESHREMTEAWLKSALEIDNEGNKYIQPWAKLYMRAKKDHSPAHEMKRKALSDIMLDFGKLPDLAFDDTPSVVEMLRKEGVFTVDVAN